MNTTQDVSRILLRELDGFRRELELFPDEASVWRTAPGVTNSAGNLTLHIAGNLQHYIGAVLGGTGYRRDRAREFGPPCTRPELLAQVDAAARVVQDILPGLPAEQLEREFPEAVGGVTLVTGLFLFHLVAHAAYHLGQAGYLRRVLTGDARTSGALPLKPLAVS